MGKRNNGEKRNAFKECFQFIYESQVEKKDMSHEVMYLLFNLKIDIFLCCDNS